MLPLLRVKTMATDLSDDQQMPFSSESSHCLPEDKYNISLNDLKRVLFTV